MINAFARLGDRMLRGVLPTMEAQASCTTKNLGPSEYAVCCAPPEESCTLHYYGTILGCSYSAVCG
jgi:hypothetical protein